MQVCADVVELGQTVNQPSVGAGVVGALGPSAEGGAEPIARRTSWNRKLVQTKCELLRHRVVMSDK